MDERPQSDDPSRGGRAGVSPWVVVACTLAGIALALAGVAVWLTAARLTQPQPAPVAVPAPSAPSQQTVTVQQPPPVVTETESDASDSCASGGSFVAGYETSESVVTVCEVSGTPYYNGTDKGSGNSISLPAFYDEGSYIASNEGYTYVVNSSALTVSYGSSTLSSQSVISTW